MNSERRPSRSAAEIITELINTIEALVDSGLATYAEVSKETKIPAGTLYSWFGTDRRFRPSADHAFTLRDWAARRTLRLAKSNQTADQACYRSAYNRICERFPVAGNGKDT